ncbi:MAG: hypothetical protein ACRD6N_01300, partial [Pyrinomonadaceae bacterium]
LLVPVSFLSSNLTPPMESPPHIATPGKPNPASQTNEQLVRSGLLYLPRQKDRYGAWYSCSLSTRRGGIADCGFRPAKISQPAKGANHMTDTKSGIRNLQSEILKETTNDNQSSYQPD